MGGVVGALVAIAIAAFVYYKFVYLRRTAEVHPSGERLEEPLLVEGGEAERVTTPVLPAALDFGDDAPLPDAAVAAAVPGWGECYQCKAPCKQGWPRCPACKSKLSLTQAGAAAQEDEVAEAGAALEDTAPCWKCQAPVRSSWPRCPGCKADKQPPPDLDASAAHPDAAQPLSPPPGLSPETSASAAMELDPAFISECWRCSAPVKLSWSVCPGCKAPTKKPDDAGGDGQAAGTEDDSMVAAERAAAGFAVECEKCHAPVKPEWPRCPGCKHPIPKGSDQAAASAGPAEANAAAAGGE